MPARTGLPRARFAALAALAAALAACAGPPAADPAATAAAPTTVATAAPAAVPTTVAPTAAPAAQPSPAAPGAAPAALGPGLLLAREGEIVYGESLDAAAPLASVPAGAIARTPAVAPDGLTVAFVGVFPPADGQRPTSKLYLVGADGSGLRALWEPAQGVITGLAWTPDGATIYAGVDGLRAADLALGGARLQEIVAVSVADGAVQPFIEDALDPAISPDGSLLAYVRAADSATDERAPVDGIELVSLDGAELRQVVPGGAFEGLAAPRFSPDGARLVFAAAGGPTAREGGPLAGLLALLAPRAAYAHGEVTYDLWEVGADGAGLRRLAELGEDDPVAAFSPDGAELAVIAAGGLYRLGADGSGLQKVSEAGSHGGLDWAGR